MNWLLENNFVLLEDLKDTKFHKVYVSLVSGFNKIDLSRVYVSIRTQEVKYDDLPEFNTKLGFAFIAVTDTSGTDLVDFFCINIYPNAVRTSQDIQAVKEIYEIFMDLLEAYYNNTIEGGSGSEWN
jgi:hypothetical protein